VELVQRRAKVARMGDFWTLIKSRQTVLLVTTGFCAYALTRGLPFDPVEAMWMAGGLLLSISGCTVLNMLMDRDIDAQMERTASRPLPAGRIRLLEAGIFGGLLSVVGLGLSFGLDLQFGVMVALGFAFDLLVYTAWLKRRTPLAIVFGGVAGGMPVLAGRVSALGRVDLVGLLLGGSVLLWIPSHILTLALRYADDYRRARVPVWPNVYGPRATRLVIAGANLLNTLVLAACTFLLRVHPVAQGVLLAMGLGMFGFSAFQLVAPTERRNWLLFKLASLYMLASSLLLTVGSVL
jgi:protoheme IX farnesyltransferase